MTLVCQIPSIALGGVLADAVRRARGAGSGAMAALDADPVFNVNQADLASVRSTVDGAAKVVDGKGNGIRSLLARPSTKTKIEIPAPPDARSLPCAPHRAGTWS